MLASRALALAVLAAILALGPAAAAQTSYVVTGPAPHPFTPLAGPGLTVLEDRSADDTEWDLQLPFEVRLGPDRFRSLTIGANGAILFPSGRQLSFSNAGLDEGDGTAGYVAAFWDDLRLYSGSGGRIAYRIEGVAPARRVAVEWLDISRFGDPASALRFQIRVHEGPAGRVDVDYGPAIAGARSFSATIGLEPASGGPALALGPPCSPSCELASWPGPDTRITTRIDAGPELFGADLRLPELLGAGRGGVAALDVVSGHGQPLGPFAVAVDLADATGGATEIGRASLRLEPYARRRLIVPIRLPATLAAGRYAARARVDVADAVREVDETNNRVDAPTALRVLPAGPNLRAVSVEAAGARAAAGSTLTVGLEVVNDGTVDLPEVRAALVLSANRVATERDRRIAAVDLGALAAGATARAESPARLPADLPPGAWYLGLRVDPEGAVPQTDSTDDAVVSRAPLVVAGAGLRILERPLASGYVGVAYRARLEATAADARWRAVAGALPPGLRLESDGRLVGVPVAPERSSVTVAAERGVQTATATFSLEVLPADTPLGIAARSLPVGSVGRLYRYAVPVVGAAGAAAGLRAEGLPLGIALSGRELVGRPTRPGTVAVTLGATTADGARASVTLDLTVRPGGRLRLEPAPRARWTVGAPVDARIAVSGGVDPVTLNAEGLPPGVRLEPGARLRGAPVEPGDFTLRVRAEDAEGATETEAYRVEVRRPEAPGVAFELSLPPGQPGVFYRAEARGPPGTRALRVEGPLPPGLSAEARGSGSLVLSGVPTRSGRYDLLFEAAASDGARALAAATLRIGVSPSPSGGCRHTRGAAPRGGWAALGALGAAWLASRRRRGLRLPWT